MPSKRSDRPDISLAVSLGWTEHGHAGSGHIKLVHPSGRKMFLPASPSKGRRSTLNNVAMVKRLTARLDGIDSTTCTHPTGPEGPQC